MLPVILLGSIVVAALAAKRPRAQYGPPLPPEQYGPPLPPRLPPEIISEEWRQWLTPSRLEQVESELNAWLAEKKIEWQSERWPRALEHAFGLGLVVEWLTGQKIPPLPDEQLR